MKKEYPNRPLVGTGALILQDGKLLLIKRRVNPGEGRWSIPGGLVELGENVQDAIKREVKEEVGLDVEITKLVDISDSISLDLQGRVKYHFVIVDFLARVYDGYVRVADDAAEARWVSLQEIEKYPLTEAFRTFFRKHKDELNTFIV